LEQNIEQNTKIKVNSSQFNYQYKKRIHFPFSISLLVTYLKSKTHIDKNFKFEKSFIFRNEVEKNIEQCKDSDILMCSCYVWNWEVTTKLAKGVKKINPKCTIIFGGPQIPDISDGFFEKYPFVDIICHGEGELIIENIFNAFLKDQDYSSVLGIETKKLKNLPQPRIDDFSTLPSPYLTNTIWDLVEKREDIEYVGSWETLRGCPYQCTFCDWGSATASKVRKFLDEKIDKEIEWFSENKIAYIDCCDANFGLFEERDLKIAQKLSDVALKKGYPQTFHPTFAKFSSERLIPIAKTLQSSGLLRAVTLAVQSMDETTLDIIKRANVKYDEWTSLTKSFRDAGIPTYTELIMGLPGETLDSFKEGLETIITDSKIGSIYMYNCAVLPNAPMNVPEYKEKHKIKTLRSPIYLQHSGVKERGMPEYEYLAVGSFSYTLDDLKEMYLYSWIIQTFHSLGILEYIANYFHIVKNTKYRDFYETFLEFMRSEDSYFAKEYSFIAKYIDKGYSGNGWDHYDPNLGEIYWPVEEATWLRITDNKSRLVNDILKFITFFENKSNLKIPKKIIEDLVQFQIFLLSYYDDPNIKSENFEYDWKTFFINEKSLREITINYQYKKQIDEKDKILWGWQAVFTGRPGRKYKVDPEKLESKEAKILHNVTKNPK
jgi:radical SAM superfamily enzyme YgiQ (UPF0313 family)